MGGGGGVPEPSTLRASGFGVFFRVWGAGGCLGFPMFRVLGYWEPSHESKQHTCSGLGFRV